MGTCTNCGSYVPPAMKPRHTGEVYSTQFEEVRTQCLACGTVYIFDIDPYSGSDSGGHVVTFLPKEPESGTE